MGQREGERERETMGQREKEELSIYQYSVEEGISSGVPRDPEPHQVTTQLPAERERERERESVCIVASLINGLGYAFVRAVVSRLYSSQRV